MSVQISTQTDKFKLYRQNNDVGHNGLTQKTQNDK